MPISAPDQEQLWRDLRDRLPQAMERLASMVDAFAPAYFRREGVPEPDVADLAQEVVVSVWDYAEDPLREPTNFRAFLKFRARGVLKTYRRGRSRPAATDVEPASREPMPDQVTEDKELREGLDACVDELAPDLREFWALHAQGLGRAEIARRLEIEAGHVSVKLFRIRGKLWACLQRKRLVR